MEMFSFKLIVIYNVQWLAIIMIIVSTSFSGGMK